MRHKAREVAFQILFQADYRPEEVIENVDAELARYYSIHKGEEGTRVFAKHLIAGVLHSRAALDDAISRSGSNWRIDRIGLTEKTILRLAIFELSNPDPEGELAPPEIVIDEAIKLAKIYADDRAPAFINGVVDAVRKMTE